MDPPSTCTQVYLRRPSDPYSRIAPACQNSADTTLSDACLRAAAATFILSSRGTDLKQGEWDGSGSTSLEQCKHTATNAGVDYFAWTGKVYGGFCKVRHCTAWWRTSLCIPVRKVMALYRWLAGVARAGHSCRIYCNPVHCNAMP